MQSATRRRLVRRAFTLLDNSAEIPEPSTVVLLLLGIPTVAACRFQLKTRRKFEEPARSLRLSLSESNGSFDVDSSPHARCFV